MKPALLGKDALPQIEAALFYYGAPMGVGRLAKLLSIPHQELVSLLGELRETYETDKERGLSLVLRDSSVQIVTKAQTSETLSKIESEELSLDLSPAALDAISIIAYLGPISRAEIEYIRGVNSSFTLRTLGIRGLIERANEESKGKAPTLFQVSREFLLHLGLHSERGLPEYEKYNAILEEVRGQKPETEEIR